MAYRPSSYRAPTWSWASVEAPIQHLECLGYAKAEFTATVVAVSCTTEGLDSRGRVSSGYLKLQGPVVYCKSAAFTVRDGSSLQESDTCVELRVHNPAEKCELDIPLSMTRNPPAKVSSGQDLTLLRISTTVALVLREVIDIPGAYRRVGIFWMTEPEQCFAGSSE
jgi:hypothetical protein